MVCVLRRYYHFAILVNCPTLLGTAGTSANTATSTFVSGGCGSGGGGSTQNTAAGEILINPNDTVDIFRIKATEDAGASVVTSAGTGIKNTAATNIVGDHITIVSDPSTDSWFMIGQSGIWGSQ